VLIYGCENLSLKLRKKHGMRVFENGLLRNIFETQKEEVRGEWRRLHDEELYTMHSLKILILFG
jgi:hypothetical protein